MKDRLERSGQRPISALVDISNYIMLELGRPSHIFDADKISGHQLHVRWGAAGEQVKLLNGQTVEVDGAVGVIADAHQVEALAGIMGGDATAVSFDTANIFIEAAFWWPESIQGRARRFNFTTEAGHRFERGVDFSTTVAHIERITTLVLDICGGQPGPIDDQILALPERAPIQMRVERCRKVIGIALEKNDMIGVFNRLGLNVRDLGGALEVTPPPYRFDIAIEEDLIEEVARLHGFDNLPALPPKASASMNIGIETHRSPLGFKHLMAARDFHEVINYSFVDEAWERDLAGNANPVRVVNPIASQMSVMRSSLFGGLLANVVYNVNRKQARVRGFEVGSIFRRDREIADGPLSIAGIAQPRMLGAIAYGPASREQWGIKTRAVDFFDLKGDLQAVLAPVEAEFAPAPHPALHPGRSARISINGRAAGFIGELHPRWVQAYGLPGAPVLFEIDLAGVANSPHRAHQEVSKFPPVLRDIALVLRADIPAGAVRESLLQAAGTQVTGVELFDEYRPQRAQAGLDETEKSLAFRVVMQDTQKTLTDAEADETVRRMVQAAQQKHQAKLRA
jgi:phenylalanyl-tRNA synthetase beta chain